jgi:hypothetical protein
MSTQEPGLLCCRCHGFEIDELAVPLFTILESVEVSKSPASLLLKYIDCERVIIIIVTSNRCAGVARIVSNSTSKVRSAEGLWPSSSAAAHVSVAERSRQATILPSSIIRDNAYFDRRLPQLLQLALELGILLVVLGLECHRVGPCWITHWDDPIDHVSRVFGILVSLGLRSFVKTLRLGGKKPARRIGDLWYFPHGSIVFTSVFGLAGNDLCIFVSADDLI